MKTVTLHILKSDFADTGYHTYPCIVDKALARAGYPHLKHNGTGIRDADYNTVWKMYDKEDSNDPFHRVLCMASDTIAHNSEERQEPEDYEVTIELDID